MYISFVERIKKKYFHAEIHKDETCVRKYYNSEYSAITFSHSKNIINEIFLFLKTCPSYYQLIMQTELIFPNFNSIS